MWQQEFTWFFSLFHREFRKGNPIAFEVFMVLAVANLFGFYNPKQLADFLDVSHQRFYAELKDWSVYHVKKMLLCLMAKQAAEQLQPVINKSASTRLRAGVSLSIDNSVIDRLLNRANRIVNPGPMMGDIEIFLRRVLEFGDHRGFSRRAMSAR